MSAEIASSFDELLELEVMGHAWSAIAEEMGSVLVRGALSPNIPVHLGAMPEAVRAVRERSPRAGNVFILNDPYAGGSHLPDLTLVEAVELGGDIVGYAAVRAHHADVGGMSPGSMPQGASELVQEGLILPPVLLWRDGTMVDDVLALILANVRTPTERRGDLRAHVRKDECQHIVHH